MISLIHILLSVAMIAGGTGSRPALLQCRTGASVEQRRCTVDIPAGKRIRFCTPADDVAGHCRWHSKRTNTRYVAWAVAERGAKCKLDKSSKRTDWSRSVTVRATKKTAAAGGTCTLFVEIE